MVKTSEQSEIDLRLVRVWLKASKAMYDLIVQDIRSHELSMENFMTLEFLYSKGPHTIQNISKKLEIPSGSITYVVNKLEERGYVKRQENPRDRRSSHVVLTETGQHLFEEIFPKHTQFLSEMVSTLNDEEKIQLTELLKKLGLGTRHIQF